MRGLTVLLACLGVAAAISVPTIKDQQVVDKDFLYRQQKVFELLSHVTQPSRFPAITKLAQEYNLEADFDSYENVNAVKEFWTMFQEGFLPHNKVFSVFYEKQRQEAIALFHVMYYAKDFATFFKFAAWAREHVNEGMFVYSFTVAVLHRKDTSGIVLPPIYEIYPYYFVNTDVIQTAYRVKMQNGMQKPEFSKYNIEYKDNNYFFNTNYTGWYVQYNREQKLSYFTEDIGLNAYYYYFHMDYPFWLGGEQVGLKSDRRGELYYFVHQQLLARYHLERMTNGLGKISTFSWRWPIKTGYYPSLQYHTGLDFPIRTNYVSLKQKENYWDIQEIDYMETLMRGVINKGFIQLKDGSKFDMTNPETIDILAQIVQKTPDVLDSVNRKVYNYYEVITRVVLGDAQDPIDDYSVIPSVLEQYETSLRDPMFWQLYKRILRFLIMYKQRLPNYTKTELSYDGVMIDNIEVDKLVTYFDNYEWDISNALFFSKEELNNVKRTRFYARQPRLNHKPFDVKMEVTSSGSYDAVVRIFLGPKFDFNGKRSFIDDSQYQFVELDTFLYKLNSGKNSIVRNSRSFWHTAKDRTTQYQLKHQLIRDHKDGKEVRLDQTEMHNFFPQRLLLPKGTRGGFPFQLYVIISQSQQPKTEYGTGFNPIYQSGVGSGARYLDNRAFGFPLDRAIPQKSYFQQSNMYWKDVSIYHMGEDYTQGDYSFNSNNDYNKNVVGEQVSQY